MALSSKVVREISFDIEKNYFLNKDYDHNQCHIFITGLARSGTTVLLNSIYQTNDFGSLSYSDMPFILSPNLWSKLGSKTSHSFSQSRERAHGDGIKIKTNSPEAFEEVFWSTFNEDDNIIEEFFNFINLILSKKKKTRYLSKNNQNIRRINLIAENFPSSKILIPFRDPLQHSYSLLKQHERFCALQHDDSFIRNYMKWIGHSEFGLDYKKIIDTEIKNNDPFQLDHWLEQWLKTYSSICDFKNSNVKFVCYENLCDNHSTWENIQSFINVKKKTEYNFILSRKEIKERYDEKILKNCLEIYELLKG